MEKEPSMTFEDIDISDESIMNKPCFKVRRSPVMVTLASPRLTHVDVQKFMEVGVNVVRLGMTAINTGEKIRLLGKIDKAQETLCNKHNVSYWPIATCMEFRICVVKTGVLENDRTEIELIADTEVVLSCDLVDYDRCNENRIFIDNPNMATDFAIGTEVFIDDKLNFVCKEIIDNVSVKCAVAHGGMLTNQRRVTVKGAKQTRPLVTKKDLQNVKFALDYEIDMILINYVRCIETLKQIKEYIDKKGRRPIIISGISTEEGLKNLDDIIKESDGIVISRNLLTKELDATHRYRMMNIQKWIGAKCQQVGKPFFISGGVFHEALKSGSFYDNELADVTNALFDGATGFILSDCDSPERIKETIKALNELCCAIEPIVNARQNFWRITDEMKMPINAAEAAVMSCATVANMAEAKVIIIPTVTGKTAKAMLWMKPASIVITVSTRTKTIRLLNLYRCCIPLLYKGTSVKGGWVNVVEARIAFAVEYAVKQGWLDYGNTYVSLQKSSDGSSFCDTVRIWIVTMRKKTRVECDASSDDIKPVDVVRCVYDY